jgi:hypothetical protein
MSHRYESAPSFFEGSDAQGRYVKNLKTGEVVRHNGSKVDRTRAMRELYPPAPTFTDVLAGGPLKAPAYDVAALEIVDHGPGKNSATRQARLDEARARQAFVEQSRREAAAAREADKRKSEELAQIERLEKIRQLQDEASWRSDVAKTQHDHDNPENDNLDKSGENNLTEG